MNRRDFLCATTSLTALALPLAASGDFEIMRSEAEWRALLSPSEYAVMREEETERAFSSPLNEEKRPGLYHCKGCDLALYDASAKYDSGTGWPSFKKSLPGAIGTREDRKLLFYLRTECHCSRCGSHLGHIFDDGPAPLGKRHCLNGLSLNFRATA